MSLFDISERAQQLQKELLDFMDAHVYPAEAVYEEQMRGLGRPARPAAGHGGAEGRGPQARPVEPVPARRRLRRRADQPRVRAARRDHRPQLAPRARGAQLRRARHRQHGGARACSAPPEQQEQWLEPLLDGRDPLGVRDDRAGRRLLRRHQHRDRDRRATATTTSSTAASGGSPGAMDPRCKIFIVMGKTDPTADRHRQQSMILVPARHARASTSCAACTCSATTTRPRRPRRDRVRRRAGAGRQPARRGGRRLRDRPGPARPRPHPPLHARASAWPSGRSS